MRRFVILGHEAWTTPDFNLNDLPGSAGRMDVLCRAIGAAFFLSHDLRRDVELLILLQDKVQIRLVGDRLRRLNPDERSTAALLKHALEKLGPDEVESTPGLFVRTGDLASILDRLYQVGAHPVVLHEEGTPIETFEIPTDPAFFLSDHLEFSQTDEGVLAGLPRVSLGRRPMHTSQCITIVHHLLDQREEADETHADLVLCHKVWGEAKALLIKGLLEDFGIPTNLMGHVPPGILPMALDGLAEVRIMVRPTDLLRAKEIIADYFEQPTNA
jgi:tRNA (pseudouridine54-N1)-methyltransferase